LFSGTNSDETLASPLKGTSITAKAKICSMNELLA